MNSMLTIMLVFRAYLAESVILSEWSKTDCEGPPTSMVVFELSDPTAESASDNNETWPYTYDFFRFENPIDNPCYYYGQGYFTINDGELCCASSLQLEETVVQSANYVYLDVDNISNSLPISIGNSHYCQFTNSVLDLDSLMGYQSVYVLQGQCFHGIYCTNDSFSIYEFENCTDLIETYSISDVLETYDTSIGIIDGVRVLVEKGTRRFVWTTYIPDRLLLPSASNLLSVLHITMLCIGLVGFMTSCVFFGVRYHHRRLRIDLLLFLTQVWIFFRK
ncbi:hypothetical protein BC833DRAFT_305961 [Globomyces pollinis-pini]|nr:hypothetical protein BC833DRAFT_305961 [Globomyces pollinis-pini]